MSKTVYTSHNSIHIEVQKCFFFQLYNLSYQNERLCDMEKKKFYWASSIANYQNLQRFLVQTPRKGIIGNSSYSRSLRKTVWQKQRNLEENCIIFGEPGTVNLFFFLLFLKIKYFSVLA